MKGSSRHFKYFHLSKTTSHQNNVLNKLKSDLEIIIKYRDSYNYNESQVLKDVKVKTM